MKRYMDTVWLKGACILSVMLIGTSMGGAGQTVSAADMLNDESSERPADLIGPIEGTSPEVEVVAVLLTGKSVAHARPGNYIFPVGTSALVPLDAASALQSSPFTFSGQLVVTYTAVCTVSSPLDISSYVDIDIELLRKVPPGTKPVVTILKPTKGSLDIFCSSDGVFGTYGVATHSITGIATAMPLADYYVQIRAKIQGGVAGHTARLADATLVIRK